MTLLYAEEPEFSAWMHPSEFDTFFTSKPNNEYPPIIEAKLLLGDGVAYRAVFIKKPSNDFKYKSVHGRSSSFFKEINIKYTNKGFVLIHHQKVMLMGGLSHQATWVRNENGL